VSEVLLKRVKLLVLTSIFTALVFAATVCFTVYTPATKGYFNLGETMVYTAALLAGPWVGALAGGVGSALADVFLGFGYYAPGTLVIKGIEGFIVGYLSSVARRLGRRFWSSTLLVLAALSTLLVVLVCIPYYSGVTELVLGSHKVVLYIPWFVWVLVLVLFLCFLTYIGFKVDPRSGAEGLCVVVGGCCMVLGYFLYEAYVLGFGVYYAAFEVPVNIGQLTVGLIVSLPVVRSVRSVLGRDTVW